MKKIFISCAAVIALGLASSAWAETVSPKGEKLNLRKGPTTSAAKLGAPLTHSDSLEVLEKHPTKTWTKVKTSDGRIGWVSSNLIQMSKATQKVEEDEATEGDEAMESDYSDDSNDTEEVDTESDE